MYDLKLRPSQNVLLAISPVVFCYTAHLVHMYLYLVSQCLKRIHVCLYIQYTILYMYHVHRTVYGTQYAKHYYAVSLFYLFLLTTNGASVRTHKLIYKYISKPKFV